MAPGNAKDFVGFLVVVGEGINAVAPGSGPAISFEKFSERIFGRDEGFWRNGLPLDHHRPARMVRNIAVVSK